jgi:DNA processing protein
MPESLDAETRALLALHLVSGLGPRLTKALLDRFGSAEKTLTATSHDLRSVRHIGDHTADGLAAAFRTVDIANELELLARHETQLIRINTPEYPECLGTIHDPPALLYVRGSLQPADGQAVAIVGSRHCTNYGLRIAERLAEGLARRGVTVISGLARGIDAAAHRGALAGGGRTIAVLAGGLAKIYPPEHAELADEVSRSGALLSEAPMGMSALRDMFPARNRLISGLSRGVLVVEAALKSGALITARHAAEQGREVLAVPGSIDSEASTGTLQLLRDGATLVRSVDDILEALGDASTSAPSAEALHESPPAAPKPAPTNLTPAQQKLWECITTEPIHADSLVQQSGLPVNEVGAALILMEMQGHIRRLPGNRFERK